MNAIDFHTHYVSKGAREVVASIDASRNAGLDSFDPAALSDAQDLEVRLHHMETSGIDTHVVSIAPLQFHYWANEAHAARIVEAANREIAEFCPPQEPERLIGLATVALQHPELACNQLREACLSGGFRGVEIAPYAAEMDLSDPQFEPFWQLADELGIVVFVHPFSCTVGSRLTPYYLSNVVGNPLDTTIGLTHLIFGGVLDRYPRIKFCAAHGGGYLPLYVGRSDHAFAIRPECQAIRSLPSEYLARMWFDSLVHSSEGVSRLVDQVGISQVVIGSDYPFEMGDPDPMRTIDALHLNDQERQAIMRSNALTLLGL